jgi:transcriptional regulator GlxA family with amidase domain
MAGTCRRAAEPDACLGLYFKNCNHFLMVFGYTPFDREQLEEVRRYLLAHMAEQIRIRQLCALAQMSRHKLNKGFEKNYGKKPLAYLHDLRMQQARQLLLNTNDSIDTIAEATGYAFGSNFLTAYKAYHGHTAGSERRQS